MENRIKNIKEIELEEIKKFNKLENKMYSYTLTENFEDKNFLKNLIPYKIIKGIIYVKDLFYKDFFDGFIETNIADFPDFSEMSEEQERKWKEEYNDDTLPLIEKPHLFVWKVSEETIYNYFFYKHFVKPHEYTSSRAKSLVNVGTWFKYKKEYNNEEELNKFCEKVEKEYEEYTKEDLPENYDFNHYDFENLYEEILTYEDYIYGIDEVIYEKIFKKNGLKKYFKPLGYYDNYEEVYGNIFNSDNPNNIIVKKILDNKNIHKFNEFINILLLYHVYYYSLAKDIFSLSEKLKVLSVSEHKLYDDFTEEEVKQILNSEYIKEIGKFLSKETEKMEISIQERFVLIDGYENHFRKQFAFDHGVYLLLSSILYKDLVINGNKIMNWSKSIVYFLKEKYQDYVEELETTGTISGKYAYRHFKRLKDVIEYLPEFEQKINKLQNNLKNGYYIEELLYMYNASKALIEFIDGTLVRSYYVFLKNANNELEKKFINYLFEDTVIINKGLNYYYEIINWNRKSLFKKIIDKTKNIKKELVSKISSYNY